MTWKGLPLNIRAAVIGVGALIALIILLTINPVYIVRSGEKALIFNAGAVQNKVIDPGMHLRIPFYQNVEKFSLQPITVDYKIPVSSDGAITKDNQTLGADTIAYYRNVDTRLVEMRTKYGEDKIKALVQSAVKESFKDVIGEYSVFDIAQNQERIRASVRENLVAKMKDYPVELTDLRIQNYDWADAFDQQIAETMKKAQQVKQAEQDLLITTQTSQKQVKEAESAKQALITTAEGEKEAAALRADAKALEGEGIKKYNMSVQANMDLELKIRQLEIEKLRVEKWNGAYVSENNYGPIPISNSSLLGK